MVALQERNFSTREEMYKGHKVVAMPSSSGDAAPAPLSVRDVVSAPRAFDPNRPRSLSAGRATTRSRDIVQEVYDRMGVNRGTEKAFDDAPSHDNNNNTGSDVRARAATPGRGGREESADKFSQRYRAAAALSSPARGTPGNERGRGADQEAPRRSRSLSRGRAVAGRWPPVQTGEQSVPQPVPQFLPRKIEPEPAAVVAPTPTSTTAVPASPNRGRAHSRTDSQEDMSAAEIESKESQEKAEATAGPSIKDRISAYAGVRNSARNFPQKKPVNYQTYASRERPKPIDIYEEARKQEDGQHEGDSPSETTNTTGPPEPSAVPPSPAAAAAADAAFAFVRGGTSSRSVKSAGAPSSSRSVKSAGAPSRTPKASAGIAGTYLGAIKSPNSMTERTPSRPVVTQTTSAPLTEISAADPTGDGNSVAASSVSADEFNFASPTTSRASVKKPSWAERNRPQSASSVGRNSTTPNGAHYNTNGNRPAAPSASEIEKIVEQRVQARVSVVEMRMEEQMQRLERRVEEKLKMRIDTLDHKIDKMNEMLAMLLSRELSAAENRDNEI